jgi:DivIVA domain-containing protein
MSSTRLPLSARPTFLPDEISRREFATVFRGYDPAEVRTFLKQLAEQSGDLSDRVAEVQKALSETEEKARNPELTEEMVTQLLGEQTAQILRSAREAATEMRRKADEEVGQQLRDAHEVTRRMTEEAETLFKQRTEEAEQLTESTRKEVDAYAEETRTAANEEAARIRNEVAAESDRRKAELDAEIIRLREQAEREMNEERARARQESRDLIDSARAEANALVQRTQARQTELVEGLVRRRKIALAQLDSLRAGRQRLLGAYRMVRSTLDDVTAELEKVEEEARQAGKQAAIRAAEATEIDVREVDQEVEVEQFQLEDDVPQSMIDLANSEEPVPTNWSTETASDGAPASAQPASATSEVIDISEERSETGSADNSSEIVDVSNAESDGEQLEVESGTSLLPSAPTGTIVRAEAELDTADIQVQNEDDEAHPGEDAEPTVIRTGGASLVIGESYADDADRALKLRRDAVIGKARAQAVRRLKRSLQDEQDSLVARLRTGDYKSVQALIGSPEDQAASYHRAVVKLLREVVRTGASSVPGSTGVERGVIDRTGTAAARRMAEKVVADLREVVVPRLENLLAGDSVHNAEVISEQLNEPYGYLKDEYVEALVDESVGAVFDEGVALVR